MTMEGWPSRKLSSCSHKRSTDPETRLTRT